MKSSNLGASGAVRYRPAGGSSGCGVLGFRALGFQHDSGLILAFGF